MGRDEEILKIMKDGRFSGDAPKLWSALLLVLGVALGGVGSNALRGDTVPREEFDKHLAEERQRRVELVELAKKVDEVNANLSKLMVALAVPR